MSQNTKYISDVIRKRIQTAGKRFHANDNISEFINENEIAQLQDEVEAKFRGVLESLVIDTESDHNTNETAKRVAKMYVREIFAGRYEPMPAVTEFPNIESVNELIVVGPITIRSACSHHFCPIMGQCWIGVMPHKDSNLIGLSKYARIAHWVMQRPQIQEEAIMQLAAILEQKLNPKGIAVIMKADHYCMKWRGVKDSDSKMTNSVMRGCFLTNSDLRKEFLSLIS